MATETGTSTAIKTTGNTTSSTALCMAVLKTNAPGTPSSYVYLQFVPGKVHDNLSEYHDWLLELDDEVSFVNLMRDRPHVCK